LTDSKNLRKDAILEEIAASGQMRVSNVKEKIVPVKGTIAF